jgi:hypothetical protein
VRLTTLPPSRAECHEIWEPKPPGTPWPTPGLLLDSFAYTILSMQYCVVNKDVGFTLVNAIAMDIIFQVHLFLKHSSFNFITVSKGGQSTFHVVSMTH